MSIKRILKYLTYLPKIAVLLGKDFDKADKEDIKRIMAVIEKSDYAEWTKNDHRIILKKFYKWLRQTEDTYPPEVKWLKNSMKKANQKLPEDILTQEEVKRMIETATNMRDKAVISVLYESGCRVGEILSMKLKSVEFNHVACSIMVNGKTGQRRILLVDSMPFMANWVSHYPNGKDPNDYLWICIGTKNHNKPMEYNSLNKILRNVAMKSGIAKKVNPHNFRHSRATHLATKFTEAQMKQYFGWTQSSEMASVYVHLSGRDLDNSILELHGLRRKEEQNNGEELKPKKCPKCEKINEFEARICSRCGQALDIEMAMKQKEKLDGLARLIDDPEILERMIERKVNEILNQKR